MKKMNKLFKGSETTGDVNEPASGNGDRVHKKHDHASHDRQDAAVIYQCPMRCEGEKTYSEPGNCPVCGMFLAPVK